MALDFSQYGGPSEEWLALEKTLPQLNFDTSADPAKLQKFVNAEREGKAAEAMQHFAPHVTIKDYSIPTRDGSKIEARSYRPVDKDASEKLPVYIYFHGGGFIFGSIKSEDPTCAQTAIKTGCVVLNVNYRHAPDHVFPTAWLDSQDAFAWLHKNIDEVGGDPSRVIVGGVSAGGTLSSSLAIEQHLGKSDVTKDLPKLIGQVLIIPCLSSPYTYDEGPGKKLKVPSYVENANAPLLSANVANFFAGLLQTGKPDLKCTKLNVGNATEDEVKGMPPSVFGIAGLDPLRDEALLYAKTLSEANVPTDITLFKGVPHGHRRFGNALKASEHWDQCVNNGILWILSKPEATGKFNVKVP
ncbi:hypothetical protein COCMIDRAFT_2154 [Bipolaris oryzae ATCC 44560]|uniref:Alpha/beta hydrolase fold-3 domain-containing protein n=1 Tax=Bipolaris oryzae ATCC 44560 TaxID=930090 RepID=W6ZZA8_COCMI|nr:uncharacterized protein COCMIDRAFT_2154 [Bipolaris oryzae ATCC 44560]EUC49091.1 hypothetical protein COCMIDRAFT_2154 [Bipolaris oryzae ATCC 44560]